MEDPAGRGQPLSSSQLSGVWGALEVHYVMHPTRDEGVQEVILGTRPEDGVGCFGFRPYSATFVDVCRLTALMKSVQRQPTVGAVSTRDANQSFGKLKKNMFHTLMRQNTQ